MIPSTSLLLLLLSEIEKVIWTCPTSERQNKGSFTAHENPTGVNIIVIADVCVTGILVAIENAKYPLFYDHWPSNQLYKG